MSIIYRPFTSEYLRSTIDCIADVWSTDNRIAKALGITYDDMIPRATVACHLALESKYNLSIVVVQKHTNRVIGFNLSYVHPPIQTQIDFEDTIKSYPAKSKAWAYFLRDTDLRAMDIISEIIKKRNLSESTPIIYGDMGGIRRGYQKTKGIWKRMKLEIGKVMMTKRNLSSGYFMYGVSTHEITIAEVKKLRRVKNKWMDTRMVEFDLADYAKHHSGMMQVSPRTPLLHVLYIPNAKVFSFLPTWLISLIFNMYFYFPKPRL